MINLNKVGVGLLSGIFGGIVAGIGARLSMRGVALAGGIPPSFSVGGTLAILVFGVILGTPFALLFVAVRRWLPAPGRWKGALFGLILALVFVAPPFLLAGPEGELALVSPLVGLGLFAPLPLAYGIVLEAAAQRLEKRYLSAAPERPVGIVWLALFGLALTIALAGAMTFVDVFPSPPAVVRALSELRIPFRFYRGAGTALSLAFAGGYFGICALIFWRGARSWMAKFTALALVAFGAAFFNNGRFLGDSMGLLSGLRFLPGLMKAVGLAALLVLLYVFPNGRFVPRWALTLAIAGCAWLFVVFVNPVRASPLDPRAWPEPLGLWVTMGFLTTGVFAQIYRYRRDSDLEQRRQSRWVVAGCVVTIAAAALLGIVMAFVPDMKVSGSAGVSALFVYAVYLLPWLLIPVSIYLSIQRYGLWEADAT